VVADKWDVLNLCFLTLKSVTSTWFSNRWARHAHFISVKENCLSFARNISHLFGDRAVSYAWLWLQWGGGLATFKTYPISSDVLFRCVNHGYYLTLNCRHLQGLYTWLLGIDFTLVELSFEDSRVSVAVYGFSICLKGLIVTFEFEPSREPSISRTRTYAESSRNLPTKPTNQ
jgi:hypothetical protein